VLLKVVAKLCFEGTGTNAEHGILCGKRHPSLPPIDAPPAAGGGGFGTRGVWTPRL